MNARVTCTYCGHESEDIDKGLDHLVTEHPESGL